MPLVYPNFFAIFAENKYDMVYYNKEQLLELPVSKLIDIILNLQEENTKTEDYRKRLQKIHLWSQSDEELEERRGRPAMTPEERAQRYEEYKARKRERYALAKAGKKDA